jgi:acylphosphatase
VIRRRVIVHGRVQGVFFRDTLRTQALRRGVAGWVRNNRDGSVEAVLEGDEERVELLLSWCRRGPAGARVDDVEVGWEAAQGERGFSVL